LEFAYEQCLARELTLQGLKFEGRKPIPVIYKSVHLECGYRIDLLVEKRVVVELKSIDVIAPVHEAVMLTYLKLSGKHLGLLINFKVPMLKYGVRRNLLADQRQKSLPTEDTEFPREHGVR